MKKSLWWLAGWNERITAELVTENCAAALRMSRQSSSLFLDALYSTIAMECGFRQIAAMQNYLWLTMGFLVIYIS